MMEEIMADLLRDRGPTAKPPSVDLAVSLRCRQALKGDKVAIERVKKDLARFSEEEIYAVFWTVWKAKQE
jgi:hypothetical protein